ncbi:MAG: D-2-hydroxyacid dehydrogenase [Pseudomonadota bacterium]
MPTALFFKPSYERLQARITAAAPNLDVALYDEDGRITFKGREVSVDDISPDYFWIHSELFFSPRLQDYFQVMLQSPSIKWLHTINTGLDKLPYLDLVEKGVTVTNNHAQAIAIAEFVLGQVLAHFQNTQDFHSKQQQKIWKHRPFREVHGSKWLIIGFGHIGQAVAQRAKAFGATITAVRRSKDNAGLADDVVNQEQLQQVLPRADVVVLTCASNADTRNMVNADFLEVMKEKSVLVNIARGDLVIEADLQKALDAGRPEYAILDVFNQEPPDADSWVWEHPRVLLTPHTSNAGTGMRARSDAIFLENLQRMSNQEPLLNQVSRRDIV